MTAFRIDSSGRWSGGGHAVMANLQWAAQRSNGLLTLNGVGHEAVLLPRNVPTTLNSLNRPIVWMPQNALPWGPPAKHERLLQRKLRVASALVRARSRAMVRISEAIPPLAGRPTSPILRNVLDPHFESVAELLTLHRGHRAGFLCIGSAHSYRNLTTAVAGHQKYLARGGKEPLTIHMSPGSPSEEKALVDLAASSSRVSITSGTLDRGAALTLMSRASAIICPSLIEASPLTVLEGKYLGVPMACSDILGHRELGGTNVSYFPSTDVGALADLLLAFDQADARIPQPEADLDYRVHAREGWAEQLLTFLTQVASTCA